MSSTPDLFGNAIAPGVWTEELAPGAVLLRGFALACDRELLAAVEAVAAAAPFRQMSTPGGLRMSVGLTNCGAVGWISDRGGYRYGPIDPLSGRHWPPLPDAFTRLAATAAAQAGFDGFSPDACLVNCYRPGAGVSLHQDRNERDFSAPIVSVSLGIPAIFLFGGDQRSDRVARVELQHGDVAIWGGPARLRYHGIRPVRQAEHPLVGARRINLTLRQAL